MSMRAKLMRLFVFSTMAVVLGLSPTAHAQTAKDVLKLVPDDAWGFLVVKSLKNVDDKAVQLKEALGLQYPTPITPMALGMLNVGDTIDMDGAVCMVVMDLQKFGGGMNFNNAAVLCVPAKDAKAFLAALAPKPETEEEPAAEEDEEEAKPAKKADAKKQPPKEEGEDEAAEDAADGVTKIALMGQKAYAATKGKYVIIGQNQDCVTKVAKTKKTLEGAVDEARLGALDKSDIYLSLSIKSLFGAYKDMFMPLLQMATAATDPEGNMVKQLAKLGEELSTLDIAAAFDQKGLALQLLMSPVKDSDFEKLMRDTKNSDKSMLSLLPQEKYLLTMGTTGGYSDHAAKFSQENWLSQMVKSAQAEGLDEEAIKKIDEEMLKMAKAAGPMALSISLLPEGKDGLFALTMVAQPKDPKEYVSIFRNIFEAAWKVSDDADVATAKNNVVHAPDAETVDGKKIDTITVNLEGLSEMLELEEGDLKQLQGVTGEEIVVRFGAVDDKHFVLALGGGKARLETICKNLKSGGNGLDKDAGIKEISGQLPSPRAVEIYVAADNIMLAVKDVAKAMGEEDEVPFDVPTVNAPLAIASAQKGGTSQSSVVVPMKLIKAIKEFVDKQMSSMMADFDEDEEEGEEGDEEVGEGEEEDDAGAKDKEADEEAEEEEEAQEEEEK